MKLFAVLTIAAFFHLSVIAENIPSENGVKIITGSEFRAFSVAYNHFLPELYKRKHIISNKIENFEFEIHEDEKKYQIFVLSSEKEVRGGGVEYWIDKKTFTIIYMKKLK